MADQSGAKPPARERRSPSLTTDQVRAFIERAPRCMVRIAVLCQAPDAAEVVETQLVNISKTGMFLASDTLLPIGTTVEFRFRLDDLIALTGTAEVMRVSDSGERGMGLRFVALDQDGHRLVADIVDMSGRQPPAGPAAQGAAPVQYEHGCLRIVLSAVTAAYFTYNPLLHIGVGGCFVPAERDVPIGTGYQLDVIDESGHLLLRCKAKVAAKQEQRIGIRLIDVDRDQLLRLRAEIAKLRPSPSL